MKRIIASFILILMLSALLVGCYTPPADNENGDDLTDIPDTSGSEGDENLPEDGGETDENEGNLPENGENSGENTEEIPTDAPSDGNGSEDTSTDTPNDTENGENNPTDTPNDTENGENNPTEPENPEDSSAESEPTAPVIGNEVGELMMNITLERVNGGSVSTGDYKGKIVILNIWATWCPPCKAEMPDFDKIASEYADDVVIIAAHDDYGKEKASDYIEANFPDSEIIFAYDTPYGHAFYAAGAGQYIPRTAIADQNGLIVYSNYGAISHSDLVAIIESLISK